VGKPEEKRLLGRPGCRWDDVNKIYLREIVWGAMHWIDLAQDRGLVECSCEHGNKPSGWLVFLRPFIGNFLSLFIRSVPLQKCKKVKLSL
jgi:hypothetical protein